MPTTSLLAACASAALLTLAAGAHAATPATTLSDPRGDGSAVSDHGGGDILRVVADQRGGLLRAVITFAEPVAATDVYLNLAVGRRLFQTRRGSVYSVQTYGLEDGPAQMVGIAPTRVAGSRVTITVPLAALGTPGQLRLQAMVTEGLTEKDLAPNRAPAPVRLAAPLRPRLGAPARVRAGAPMTLNVRGFAPRSRVTLHAVPTRYRGGNGFGVKLGDTWRTDRTGALLLRTRLTPHFFACAGVSSCRPHPWRRGERIDLTVCSTGSGAVCARTTARLR